MTRCRCCDAVRPNPGKKTPNPAAKNEWRAGHRQPQQPVATLAARPTQPSAGRRPPEPTTSTRGPLQGPAATPPRQIWPRGHRSGQAPLAGAVVTTSTTCHGHRRPRPPPHAAVAAVISPAARRPHHARSGLGRRRFGGAASTESPRCPSPLERQGEGRRKPRRRRPCSSPALPPAARVAARRRRRGGRVEEFGTRCLPSREQCIMEHHIKQITRNERLHRTTVDQRKAPRQAGCLRLNIQDQSLQISTIITE